MSQSKGTSEGFCNCNLGQLLGMLKIRFEPEYYQHHTGQAFKRWLLREKRLEVIICPCGGQLLTVPTLFIAPDRNDYPSLALIVSARLVELAEKVPSKQGLPAVQHWVNAQFEGKLLDSSLSRCEMQVFGLKTEEIISLPRLERLPDFSIAERDQFFLTVQRHLSQARRDRASTDFTWEAFCADIEAGRSRSKLPDAARRKAHYQRYPALIWQAIFEAVFGSSLLTDRELNGLPHTQQLSIGLHLARYFSQRFVVADWAFLRVMNYAYGFDRQRLSRINPRVLNYGQAGRFRPPSTREDILSAMVVGGLKEPTANCSKGLKNLFGNEHLPATMITLAVLNDFEYDLWPELGLNFEDWRHRWRITQFLAHPAVEPLRQELVREATRQIGNQYSFCQWSPARDYKEKLAFRLRELGGRPGWNKDFTAIVIDDEIIKILLEATDEFWLTFDKLGSQKRTQYRRLWKILYC